MRIKIVRQVLIAGEPARVGTELDLDSSLARSLVNQGSAEFAAEQGPAPVIAFEPPQIEPVKKAKKAE